MTVLVAFPAEIDRTRGVREVQAVGGAVVWTEDAVPSREDRIVKEVVGIAGR